MLFVKDGLNKNSVYIYIDILGEAIEEKCVPGEEKKAKISTNGDCFNGSDPKI